MVLGASGEEIEEDWPIWRLVLSQIATLTELDTSWSFDDLVQGNLALTLLQSHHERAGAGG